MQELVQWLEEEAEAERTRRLGAEHDVHTLEGRLRREIAEAREQLLELLRRRPVVDPPYPADRI
jgi:hypothetical protein